MNESLKEDFLIELFKLCLKKREIIEACKKVLKYQYLPSASYKEIWKQINQEYSFTKSIPSLGVLFQNCKDNEKVLDVLEKIKDIDTPNESQVMHSLEEFVKNSMCIDFYDSFQELYNQGNRDKAIKLLEDTSKKLNTFTLASEYSFTPIFKNFRDRQYQKKIDKEFQLEEFGFVDPVYGIDEMDFYYPIKRNTTSLFAAQSGVGKTTYMTYCAIENARRGGGVLFITSEGTQEQLEEKFDTVWTGMPSTKIEDADLSDEEISKLSKIAEQIYSMGGEVELCVFNQFHSASMINVHEKVQEYKKVHGKAPNVLILDYLELFAGQGDDKKDKMQEAARSFLNIVKSEGIDWGLTANQCSDIDVSLVNSEEYCITRNSLKYDKGLLDCFSAFFSLNQTIQEYNNDTMRIFMDKSRHSSKKNKQIFHIATKYPVFYDRKRTLQEFATSLV